jgi:catechol 2,3-dioxygenase-like lactoylglutathione lyase family enzyme
MLEVRSATFALRAPDAARARDWYERLLGRPPDLIPVDGVFEWRLAPGAWLQVAEGTPGGGAVLRLGVPDLDAASAALAAAGARLGDVERIPGIIASCDAEDPFGNVLSLYEELED